MTKKTTTVRTTKNRKIKTAPKTDEQKKLTYEQKKELKLKSSQEKQRLKEKQPPANRDRFYCTNKELYAELEKWRDSAERPEDRTLSEELGRMMIAIGTKVLNRSEFRNYSKELKEDMASFGYFKIIRGLKNYDFRFKNSAFCFFTTAFFNAYLTILKKHYKHINIKKDLMEKLLSEMETFPGMNTSSSLTKAIKQYLGDDREDPGEE